MHPTSTSLCTKDCQNGNKGNLLSSIAPLWENCMASCLCLCHDPSCHSSSTGLTFSQKKQKGYGNSSSDNKGALIKSHPDLLQRDHLGMRLCFNIQVSCPEHERTASVLSCMLMASMTAGHATCCMHQEKPCKSDIIFSSFSISVAPAYWLFCTNACRPAMSLVLGLTL